LVVKAKNTTKHNPFLTAAAGGVEHNVAGRDLVIPVHGRLKEVVAVGNRVLEKAFVVVAEGLPGESSVGAGSPGRAKRTVLGRPLCGSAGAERRHPAAFHTEAPTPSALWKRKRE
jgi:hypothetical protein